MKSEIKTGPGGVTNCRECIHCFGWTQNIEKGLKYRCMPLEKDKGKRVFLNPKTVRTKIRRDCPAVREVK